jgi:hypothetical protein
VQDFHNGPPKVFRDLLHELKRFLGIESLFSAVESPEKINLMRKAWDMGKDPLTIMRSSPHAVSLLANCSRSYPRPGPAHLPTVAALAKRS